MVGLAHFFGLGFTEGSSSPSETKKNSFHCAADWYAETQPEGTLSVHVHLLMSSKACEPQVGGVVAWLMRRVIAVQSENASWPMVFTLEPNEK